jgi:hypothetical protein
MTEEHLAALLGTAKAKKDDEGWQVPSEGRLVTLYVASNGASMNVGRVEALQAQGTLLKARTVKGELYVLALEDVFAAAIEPPAATGRKAGFV